MRSELGKLVELQKTDSRIRQLKENIETADERRAKLEQEFEKHASSIREIQNDRDEARANRAELEAKIAEAKTSLERAKRNLQNAQDQKQYEAAMKEIAVLEKEISNHETGTLESMEIIEEAEKVLEERADEVNNLESDWEKTQADFEKELKKNKRECKKLTNGREDVFTEVSPQLAAVYNRLVTRSRDGIAVAEAKGGACSACFMKIRPQVLVELKTTGEIITCESCAKILYIANQEQNEASA